MEEKQIYVVEFRCFENPYKANITNPESDAVYFCTSKERAEAFMSANKNWEPDRKRYTWWWSLTTAVLDDEFKNLEFLRRENNLEFYDWDGNRLDGYQPCHGYEDMYEFIRIEHGVY